MTKPHRRINNLFSICQAIEAIKNIVGYENDGILENTVAVLELRLTIESQKQCDLTSDDVWICYHHQKNVDEAIKEHYFKDFKESGYQGSFEDFVVKKYYDYCGVAIYNLDYYNWEQFIADRY